MPLNVELKSNGRIFSGWEDIAISRSVEQLSGMFSFSVPGGFGAGESWRIKTQDTIEIIESGDRIILGYIDSYASSFSGGGASSPAGVSGRDKTADLIDCSIENPKAYEKITLRILCKSLCLPFGVEVVDLLGSSAKFDFQPQLGESPFQAMSRHARMVGAVLTQDNGGNLLITKSGTAKHAGELYEGQDAAKCNMEEGDGNFSFAGRFSHYIVKTQPPWGAFGGKPSAANLDGHAVDGEVLRYRPKMIQGEATATKKEANARAAHEKMRNNARAERVECTVQGWRDSEGELYAPNKRIMFTSERIGVEQELLISSVVFSANTDTGTTTRITLVRPGAYDIETEEPKSLWNIGGAL